MNKNIIQKAFLHLQYNGNVNGITLQKTVGDWANEELIKALDLQLQKVDKGNSVVKLDRVDIEVDLLDEGDLTDRLSKIINEQLGEVLGDSVGANESVKGADTLSLSQSFGQTLLFFLEHGSLPWWSKIDQQIDFFDELAEFINTEPAHQLVSSLKILVTDQEIQKRIVWQLPTNIFYGLVYWLSPELKTQLPVLISEVDKIRSSGSLQQVNAIDMIFKRSVLQAFKTENHHVKMNAIAGSFLKAAEEKVFSPLMNKAIKEISTKVFKGLTVEARGLQQMGSIEQKGKDMASGSGLSQSSIKKEEGTARSIASEGIYIKNAGLVIIAGFLPHFFRQLEILNENIITDKSKAAAIVQFLASGKEAAAEFELGISKLLCGLEMEEPLDTSIIFSEQDKNEANELLLSAIEYWNILRDTSVDAFRESFLMRDGKLWFEDDEWHLRVEQRSYDMLLQQLPWNINIIRLPWMRYPLRTEWVY